LGIVFILLIFVSVTMFVFFFLGLLSPIFQKKYEKIQVKRDFQIKRQMEDSFIFWEKRRKVLVYLCPFLFGGLGLLASKNLIVGAVGFIFGFVVPNLMLVFARRQRIKKMRGQLVDCLMILASSLKAGLSFLQAIEVLCEEMPAPASQEFGLILSENKLGVSLEDSFRKLRKRIQIEEINLVVTSILIARESGGELPRILSRLADTIRDNLKLKEKIGTLTLQGRLQGFIMMILPFAFAWFVYKQNPGHFDVMFQTAKGRQLLALAAFLQVVGGIMVQRISIMRF